MSEHRQSIVLSAARVKAARTNRGWSQAKLAEVAGYSDRLIRKAESGRAIAVSTAEDIAQSLSTTDRVVTVNDLAADPVWIAKRVLECYDKYAAEMLDYCADLFHPDFVFRSVGDESSPLSGDWAGCEGFQGWLNNYFALFSRPYPLSPEFVLSGQTVIARYIEHSQFQELISPPLWMTLHLHFRDGLVVLAENQYDTLTARAFLDEVLRRLQAGGGELPPLESPR